MTEFSFQALGTHWSIVIDGDSLKAEDQEQLLRQVEIFEKRFSRFIPTSEVNQFRVLEKGEYQVSPEFSEMLKGADTLRNLTDGVYDPAIGMLLEGSGYDQNYTLVPNVEKIKNFQLASWSVKGETLFLEEGQVCFDFGGIGKGYCIDRVAELLKEQGYQYFLVEAGGDMYGTTKADGSAFQIALEWPGKPGIAFGTIELREQGLAVSDSFRRRWPAPTKTGQKEYDWHHIIDPQTKNPIKTILGCAATAKTAFEADCMTSGLFLSHTHQYEKLQQAFNGEYVVFREEEKVLVSPDWPGTFFATDTSIKG